MASGFASLNQTDRPDLAVTGFVVVKPFFSRLFLSLFSLFCTYSLFP